ncbi:hypothetical protein [Gynuella sp.]|uniref:hypothetical protein n=1 Tax=Gynuella sp. TaxID=2969146 RepID=UPI003D0D1CB9
MIEKEKIKGVSAFQDNKFTTIICAKGMADDIGVHAGDSDTQLKIVNMVKELSGGSYTEATRNAGLFARSGKSIILSICSAIITAALYFLVSGIHPEEVDRVGRNSGKEEMLYSLANTLGPNGTLLLGGAITVFLMYRAYKSSKNSYQIIDYTL